MVDNVVLALTIANRLLALIAASRKAGGDVSDEQLEVALTKAVRLRDEWYALGENTSADDFDPDEEDD